MDYSYYNVWKVRLRSDRETFVGIKNPSKAIEPDRVIHSKSGSRFAYEQLVRPLDEEQSCEVKIWRDEQSLLQFLRFLVARYELTDTFGDYEVVVSTVNTQIEIPLDIFMRRLNDNY